MSGFAEFYRGPWRLRAVLCEDAKVEGDEDLAAAPVVYIWFIGRGLDQPDEWFAHGVSDYFSSEAADSVFDTLDGAQMDVLLAYGGVDWETLEDPKLVPHFAMTQRNLANEISEQFMNDLLKMPASEIRKLRKVEDAHVDKGHSSN